MTQHGVHPRPFTPVLPQVLSLSFFTFFSSNSGALFLLQCRVSQVIPVVSPSPGDNQGEQCLFLFWLMVLVARPLCCNSAFIYPGEIKPRGRLNSKYNIVNQSVHRCCHLRQPLDCATCIYFRMKSYSNYIVCCHFELNNL